MPSVTCFPSNFCLHSKRPLKDIFRKTSLQGSHTTIQASYMEIYKDEVYDLLVDRETVSALVYILTCARVNVSIRPSSYLFARTRPVRYSLRIFPPFLLEPSRTSSDSLRKGMRFWLLVPAPHPSSLQACKQTTIRGLYKSQLSLIPIPRYPYPSCDRDRPYTELECV